MRLYITQNKMNQLSRGQNPVGIPIDEITHVGQTVSNWDFETQTSIESPDDVQGAIRVYHTPREGIILVASIFAW